MGFKWFVEGSYKWTLCFAGEESAGGTFTRFDGSVWTTDKDGIILALLAAEMTAELKKDPGEIYQELTKEFGVSFFDRLEAKATSQQKEILKHLSPSNVNSKELAGENITSILVITGNGAPIGGLKVVAEQGWFAARPSGTEGIYKIYGESFRNPNHLNQILQEAETIVTDALSQSSSKNP